MKAHLISIGNEITGGVTLDTNSPWLARRLAAMGIVCTRHVSVADELEPIRDVLTASAGAAGLVVVTGGLGPTPDDLTRDALAAAMGVPLELHEPSLRRIEAYFAERGRTMHAGNQRQTMAPRGAEMLDNDWGTAPGICADLGGARVFCLPGVPHEMRAMFEARVAPRLSVEGRSAILMRTLRTFGMSESEVGERLADLMRRDRNPTVGTSAAEMIIAVRVVARADSAEAAARLLEEDAGEIRRRLGRVVFGEDGDGGEAGDGEAPVRGGRVGATGAASSGAAEGGGLPEPAQEFTLGDAVGRLLKERGRTLAVAESCTGGLVAKYLTDVPGSSAYFVEGLVTYSNEAKVRLLGVPRELIAAHGAVSEAVARAMAEHCRARAGVDFALATTGIAGPSGGTATKPVGLVYVALAAPDGTIVKELRLGANLTREQVRDRSAKAALNLLRLRLLA